MRLSLFLLFLTVAQVLASESYSQTTRLSLNMKNVSVMDVLNEIEDQTEFYFLFNQKLVDVERKVDIEVRERKIDNILSELFAGTKVRYLVMNKQIVLTTGLPEEEAIQQQKSVTGKVTDTKGQPLPGVTVVVKGTTTGTITNADGNYSFTSIPDNATLVFSFVGMKIQEVGVAGKTTINVTMEEETIGIDEVVAIGYGTQRKRDVTGSVSSVRSEEIKAFPIVSTDQALQGRSAGVQVFQTSGAPGGAVQVRIRGLNSTAGGGANQPLYVLDGIPLSSYNETLFALTIGNEGSTGAPASNAQSPLSTINPNDIESIEVLKDASATAIYGSRAANGVVMITTRTGKSGKAKIEFNTYYGVQSLRHEIPVLNSRERMISLQNWRRNNGTNGTDEVDVFAINPFLHSQGTNWQQEVFRTAPTSNYNLSISGGTDKLTFNVSGDYLQQDGIIINTFSNRGSFRTNIDFQATEKLKIGTRTSLNYQWDNTAMVDASYGGLAYIFNRPPTQAIRDASGNYTGRPNTLVRANLFASALSSNNEENYVAELMENERKAHRYRVNSSVYGEYKLLPYLVFKSTFGIDYMFGKLRTFVPIWQRGVQTNNAMSLYESRPQSTNWVADQYLTFDKSIDDHSINAVLGFSAQQTTNYFFAVSATGSASNVLNTIGNQPTYTGTPSGGQVSSGLVSQFLRVNYGFRNRYLFTGTVRRDGSSRFGENYKYGYFPSFSLGWRITEENFMEELESLSNLKLRVSYGITGNQNIGDFLYKALAGSTNAVFGDNIVSAVAPYRFENNDIQWEKNKQFDIGLDMGLLRNRINVVADYYRKTTDGLLADFPISAISGVGTSVIRNIGIIENKGFELAINSVIIEKKDLKWTVDFNISANKNQVVTLGKQPYINGVNINRINTFINRTQPGEAIGAFYVLETAGLYTSWEEAAKAPVYKAGVNVPYFTPGDRKIVDQNKDGIIDDADRVFIGSPLPDYYGGVSTNLTYKNVSLNVTGSFQHGNLIYNFPHLIGSLAELNVWRDVYENMWSPANPSVQTKYPIARVSQPIMPSTDFLEDGSFFRVRSISLSYDFPKTLVNHIKLSRVKLYAQANNFFVFTKYEGWDPEVNSFGSTVLTNGIDYGAYPQSKSIIFGINVNF